jgi:hypothetical protein
MKNSFKLAVLVIIEVNFRVQGYSDLLVRWIILCWARACQTGVCDLRFRRTVWQPG